MIVAAKRASKMRWEWGFHPVRGYLQETVPVNGAAHFQSRLPDSPGTGSETHPHPLFWMAGFAAGGFRS